MDTNIIKAVADPGFPWTEGANSTRGVLTFDFAIFLQKLHEIERIWAPGGGGLLPHAPLTSATEKFDVTYTHRNS